MTYSLPNAGGSDRSGPAGYTYAAVLVQVDADQTGDEPGIGDRVLSTLHDIGFTGWLSRPDAGWLVALCGDRSVDGAGSVASGRRGVVGVAETLVQAVPGTVVAVRVVRDRQLLIVVWAGGEEVGRYLSDPSFGLPEDDDTLPDPIGVEHADAFAAACGYPGNGDALGELLAEELDPDSVIESERLTAVLRLLGLPQWLVSSPSLPRDIPTGPRTAELTRLGAGRPGVAGRASALVTGVVRRRRPPPPAVADPPRGDQTIDPWLL